MPKTVLAVDDSATIRKVLEITFAAEDFRVVTADGSSSALGRLGEDPAIAVIDTSLGNDDGYALAKELRARSARLGVLLMASRYNPYDANRGRDAGADDFIEKPFDTQSLIDKVKKVIATREQMRAAPPAPPPAPAQAPPAPAPYTPPSALHTTSPFGSPPRPPAAAPAPPPPGAGPAVSKPAAWPAQRTHTLSFEGGGAGGPPGVIVPASMRGLGAPPAPPAPAPQPQPLAPTPAVIVAPPPAAMAPTAVAVPVPFTPAPASRPGPVGAPIPRTDPTPSPAPASNGHSMANKLSELGLTPQQADAVLALSRELVERVVWEVVPTLAETLIKEEIARLTKDS